MFLFLLEPKLWPSSENFIVGPRICTISVLQNLNIVNKKNSLPIMDPVPQQSYRNNKVFSCNNKTGINFVSQNEFPLGFPIFINSFISRMA